MSRTVNCWLQDSGCVALCMVSKKCWVIVIRNAVQSHVASPCSNPLNTALEWRFTGGSSVTLEGNRGAQDDIYCWIEVLGSVWTPHWDEFVRAVFDAWTAIEPDLKPHW